MTSYKVVIDARRRINSGIGRVSQWLSNNATALTGSADCMHLVAPGGAVDYGLRPELCIETEIVPFSADEVYKLPELVADVGADLYINPQTTWSPFHCVKSINVIHDLWAVNNPDWLPTEDDLKHRFNLDDIYYFRRLSKWFSSARAERLLTTTGYARYIEAKRSGNIISQGVWAQYAATVEFSAVTVTVSDFIKEAMKELFPRANDAVVIPNVPKNFLIGESGPKRHLLTLSKLEKRKNLDTLLDAYVIYADRYMDAALPLIIAGDPGYKSVANTFSERVTSLCSNGYNISLRNSVTDEALSRLFKEAACLIFPTHFEGFGLPPLEAMLASVPVIATRTGMMASSLGQFARLVDPFNPGGIAEAISHCTQSAPSHAEIARARSAVNEFISRTDSLSLWRQAVARASGVNSKSYWRV